MSLIPPELIDAPVVGDIQKFAVEAIEIPYGLHMEFGVFQGRSLEKIRRHLATDRVLYGFDSFLGLPEGWREHASGSFRTGYRPDLPNTEIVEGWFEDTVPKFAADHPQPVSFIHIDCDLYSSTKTVLDGFNQQIVPGTVILFDELFGYEGYVEHEYRALREWGRRYEALARWDSFRAVVQVMQ